ncbi:hypothetical protein [Paenibacillus paeoniae]|uniref:Radical SAM protein n=1 Tax=Paenibacillus paeoniae TaxID=2292705 RepID=A0A371PMQ3_9BACL|nr:hypothetical protein [Paenibacillus paeoniae]REK77480.1 hypothetical protein DX130_10935 [Paenibacillus paeoniae]
MAGYNFVWNDRLRIHLPSLEKEWNQYSEEEQSHMIERWELIRGRIPDLIMELEHTINGKQSELYEEEDFKRSCVLNYEIAEQASRINDLLIWYRMNQELESRRHS